jgi:acetyl-CoA carboxylase / biotin carboxylase 1
MKMYMPLAATEDGTVQFVKQAGVTLEPGDILGILTLDDPARVKHAKPFDGLLPDMGDPSVVGNKPHQRLGYCLSILNDQLDGYDNQAIMNATFKDLLDVLHDPELPFAESTAILATLSGRLPAKLEDSVRTTIDAARTKGEVADFPAPRLKKILDHYLQDSVRAQDRAMFRTQFGALFDVVDRYVAGMQVHEKNTLAQLLNKFSDTEKLFGGSIEARVLMLRDQYKDDPDKVAALVFSHIQAQCKAKLAMLILDYIKSRGWPSTAESQLRDALHALTALETK